MKKALLYLSGLCFLCGQTATADVISEVEVENPAYFQQQSLAFIGISLAAIMMLFFVLRLKNQQIPLKNLLRMPVFYFNLGLLLTSLIALLFIRKTTTKEEYTGPARPPEVIRQDTTSTKPDSIHKP